VELGDIQNSVKDSEGSREFVEGREEEKRRRKEA
jgi:hypothetical protein